MRVWTRQNSEVLEELKNKGVYRTKKNHVFKKYDDCSGMFMVCYDWLIGEASKRLKPPGGIESPIWLALRPDFLPGPSDGTVVLEMDVPRDSMLVFDMGKWDYILNYWYIPSGTNDRDSFRKELEDRGIRNQSQIVMTDFHPVLKRRIIKSWERLFDGDIRISENDQAICWEIRNEWIVRVG